MAANQKETKAKKAQTGKSKPKVSKSGKGKPKVPKTGGSRPRRKLLEQTKLALINKVQAFCNRKRVTAAQVDNAVASKKKPATNGKKKAASSAKK